MVVGLCPFGDRLSCKGAPMLAYGRRKVLGLGAGLALSACSLPRGAAQQDQILRSIDARAAGDHVILPVTRDLIARMADWPMTGGGPRGGWLSGGGAPRERRIAPGDRLDLVIWDSAETSLLTAGGQRAVPLTGITVAADGRIFMPYLDRVEVAGLTVEAARQRIQTGLAAIAPSAQVQLAATAGRGNSVDLVGGVAQPGSYPLADGPVSVLSMVAQAGGPQPGLRRPLVRLTRGGRSHVTTLARLYAEPGLDAALQPGDKLMLEEDPRSFVALGAAGREQIVPFPEDRPSALTALGAMGGVNDQRADPQAVLVLREYPASAIRDGQDGPAAARVIFVIDMTTADGLFSAGRFVVHPDDVFYVSESPVTALATITQIVGQVFGAGNQARNLTE